MTYDEAIAHEPNLPWKAAEDPHCRAEFRCKTCGEVAVVVSRQGGGVAVTGFLGNAWHRFDQDESGAEVVDIDQVIQAADAERLHQINPEFIPSWCPKCRASYCVNHWTLQTVMADDYPGWYEATYGKCPKRHRRQLDD